VTAAIEGAGTQVRILRADVSDRVQVAGVLAEIQKSMPPLRGVVHAAGVLDDRTVLQMDAARFRRVLAPKMYGAWNLHELTAGSPLDFFVMYSSAVSLLGSPGQANYAAANAFLDALAHHRRALGLPALSVNWGPFSQVGLAAAQEIRGQRLSQRGMGSISPEQGLDVLRRLLRSGAAQVGVVPLDVRQWIAFYPSTAGSPFLTKLLGEHDLKSSARQGASLREELQRTEPGARAALLEKYLAARLAQVLRLEATSIDRTASFGGIGLDSLMSIELRNRLENDLGIRLSATLLFTYPTLVSLSANLLERIGYAGGAPHGVEPEGGATETSLSTLDDLSEEETAALFEAKIASIEERLK
jgi:acyl carrier protein